MGEFLKNIANRLSDISDNDIFADERRKRSSGGAKNSITESQDRLRELSKAGMRNATHPHRNERASERPAHPLFD